jgi:hypothetical protein
LAGWNDTLRRGKGKKRKTHVVKGRKEEGKRVRRDKMEETGSRCEKKIKEGK